MSNYLSNAPISLLLSGHFQEFALQVLYMLPALVIALSFHEAAHAWMANKMGDPTAKNLGRVTLDPTKHIDLFGFLCFILVGFGWGKPCPVNPRNYYNYKKGNVLVSLAGVIMNLILSFVFYLILFVLNIAGVTIPILNTIIMYIVFMNILLFFFNLIPIPPLDGHHLISGFIARKSPKFYMYYMQYGYFVLLAILFFTNWIQIALDFLSGLIITLYSLLFGLFL